MRKLSLTLMPCVLAALLLLLFGTVSALAQGPSGPDQYIENVPGADGEGGDGGNASNGVNLNDPQASLPAGADQALDELGADGVQAAALAEALATESPDGNGNGGGSGDGAGSPVGSLNGDKAGGDDGRGGLGGVVDALVSPAGDGMGLLLPLFLLGVLIAGGAFALRSRIGRTPHDAAS